MLKNVIVFLCLVAVAAAQTKPASAAKPAAKPADSTPAGVSSNGLPSEETINAFMQQMVGYNPEVTWRVAEIRPTAVPALTEVLVVITDPKGSNSNKFYVTPTANMPSPATSSPSARSPLNKTASSSKRA